MNPTRLCQAPLSYIPATPEVSCRPLNSRTQGLTPPIVFRAWSVVEMDISSTIASTKPILGFSVPQLLGPFYEADLGIPQC